MQSSGDRVRRGRAPAIVIALAALGAVACTSLPGAEPGTCGNGLVEPELGEDCDRSSAGCGAPGTAAACRLTCTTSAECPATAVCGWTGVCSVPSGAFERTDADELAFTSRFLVVGDVDDDEDVDLVGVDDVAVTLRAGAVGATFAPPVALAGVPVQGLPLCDDFTGDGAADVVFSTGIGTEVLTAAYSGIFEPTFQPTFALGGEGGFVANSITYMQPSAETADDELVQSLVNAVDLPPGTACASGCSVIGVEDEAVLMPGRADALLVARLPVAPVAIPSLATREEFIVALPFRDANPSLPGDQDGLFLVRVTTAAARGGAATLAPPTPVPLPVGATLVSASFADLDGLSGRELVVSYTVAGATKMAIAVGRNDGTFAALMPVTFVGEVGTPVPLLWADVAVGGFDELVAADGLSLVECTLATSICARAPVSAASVPWLDAVIGDLDGDGFLDVVAARRSTSTIDVRFGTGLPYIWNPASMSAPGEVRALRAGDFDGNDLTDVAIAFSNDGSGSAIDLAVSYGAFLAPPLAPVRIARVGKLLALEPLQQIALGLDLVEDLVMVYQRGGNRAGSVLVGSANRSLIAPQIPTGEGQPIGVESLTVEAVVATPFADQPTPSLVSLVIGRGLFETRARSVTLFHLVADERGDLTSTMIGEPTEPPAALSAFEFADALWVAIVGGDGVTRVYGGDRRGAITMIALDDCAAGGCAPESLLAASTSAQQISQLTALDLDGMGGLELVAIRSPRGDDVRASEVMVWRGGVETPETIPMPDERRAFAVAALRTTADGPASVVLAADGGVWIAAPDDSGRYTGFVEVELAVRDADDRSLIETHEFAAVGVSVADVDRDGQEDLIVTRGGDPRTASALAIYTQRRVPGGAGLAAGEGQ